MTRADGAWLDCISSIQEFVQSLRLIQFHLWSGLWAGHRFCFQLHGCLADSKFSTAVSVREWQVLSVPLERWKWKFSSCDDARVVLVSWINFILHYLVLVLPVHSSQCILSQAIRAHKWSAALQFILEPYLPLRCMPVRFHTIDRVIAQRNHY